MGAQPQIREVYTNENVEPKSLSSSIGNILKKARKEKGGSIPDAARFLNLQKEYLSALEEDDYSGELSGAYGAAFLRVYAKYLGLDPNEVVKQARIQGLIGEARHRDLEEPKETESLPSKSIVIGAILVAVAVFAWWGSYLTKDRMDIEKAPILENEAMAAEEMQVELAAVMPEAGQAPAEQKSEDGVASLLEGLETAAVPAAPQSEVSTEEMSAEAEQTMNTLQSAEARPVGSRIMLEAKGSDVWFQIRNVESEKIYVNRTIEQGETYWVKPWQNVVLDTGNPASLNVYVDGSLMGASSMKGGTLKGLLLKPEYLTETYFGQKLNLP